MVTDIINNNSNNTNTNNNNNSMLLLLMIMMMMMMMMMMMDKVLYFLLEVNTSFVSFYPLSTHQTAVFCRVFYNFLILPFKNQPLKQ